MVNIVFILHAKIRHASQGQAFALISNSTYQATPPVKVYSTSKLHKIGAFQPLNCTKSSAEVVKSDETPNEELFK